MDERVATNRRRWDEMAVLHETTYFTPGALVTDGSLTPFEVAELGDLAGQRVCHLQCHIGGDSLALVARGPAVVGVDFSSASIEIARRRTAVAGLDDRVSFVCATVDEAPDQMPTPFDGVYTSWGALCWLPDIDAWARVVHRLLRPGGWVYVAETHPYATSTRWPDYAYGGAIAQFDDGQGDYTDAAARFEHPESWEWNHSLGEIVSALAGAGMRIEWLHEHTVAVWHLNEPEHLVRRADGLWESPGSTLPLSFSLRAVRPG